LHQNDTKTDGDVNYFNFWYELGTNKVRIAIFILFLVCSILYMVATGLPTSKKSTYQSKVPKKQVF